MKLQAAPGVTWSEMVCLVSEPPVLTVITPFPVCRPNTRSQVARPLLSVRTTPAGPLHMAVGLAGSGSLRICTPTLGTP